LPTKKRYLGAAETPLPKAENTRWNKNFIRSLNRQGNKGKLLDASGFGDMQERYIASNIQTESHRTWKQSVFYIRVSGFLMDGSKASDGDGVYPIVAEPRQPRNLLRTIAIRLHLGCNLIDVKASSCLTLFKDCLVELMFPL
jgi:hypothetical protein